jgi:hypothetical protein
VTADSSRGRGQIADDAVRAARDVGRALRRALAEELLAVYLHGSAVLGGFRWERSDLDILALSRTNLTDQQVGAVVGGLAPLAYPANGLEFSLMTAVDAAQPALPRPRFQVHQTTDGWSGAGKVVDGRILQGDADLILHMAVCREHGIAIVGPPPRKSLAAVPDEAILVAMRAEIDWARGHASPEYLVLTSARAWLFVETRQLSSKIAAGEWACERYEEAAVIETALARQRGRAVEVATEAAQRLADRVAFLIRPG